MAAGLEMGAAWQGEELMRPGVGGVGRSQSDETLSSEGARLAVCGQTAPNGACGLEYPGGERQGRAVY